MNVRTEQLIDSLIDNEVAREATLRVRDRLLKVEGSEKWVEELDSMLATQAAFEEKTILELIQEREICAGKQ